VVHETVLIHKLGLSGPCRRCRYNFIMEN